MSRSSKLLLAAVALTLLTAVGVQGVLLFREPPRASLGQPLSSFLPVDPAGWLSRDLPLGNTESMDQRSRDLLNFDDFAYR